MKIILIIQRAWKQLKNFLGKILPNKSCGSSQTEEPSFNKDDNPELWNSIINTANEFNKSYTPFYLKQLDYLNHLLELSSPQYEGCPHPFYGFGISFGDGNGLQFNRPDWFAAKKFPSYETLDWSVVENHPGPVEVLQKHVYNALIEMRKNCIDTLQLMKADIPTQKVWPIHEIEGL